MNEEENENRKKKKMRKIYGRRQAGGLERVVVKREREKEKQSFVVYAVRNTTLYAIERERKNVFINFKPNVE